MLVFGLPEIEAERSGFIKFYYDVMPPEGVKISDADFVKIEKKMQELVQRKEALVRSEIAKSDALVFFGDRGQTYKNELIAELEDGKITQTLSLPQEPELATRSTPPS